MRPFGFDRGLNVFVEGAFRPEALQRLLAARRLGVDLPGGLRVARRDLRPKQKVKQRIGLIGTRRIAGNGESVEKERIAFPGVDETNLHGARLLLASLIDRRRLGPRSRGETIGAARE